MTNQEAIGLGKALGIALDGVPEAKRKEIGRAMAIYLLSQVKRFSKDTFLKIVAGEQSRREKEKGLV